MDFNVEFKIKFSSITIIIIKIKNKFYHYDEIKIIINEIDCMKM